MKFMETWSGCMGDYPDKNINDETESNLEKYDFIITDSVLMPGLKVTDWTKCVPSGDDAGLFNKNAEMGLCHFDIFEQVVMCLESFL